MPAHEDQCVVHAGKCRERMLELAVQRPLTGRNAARGNGRSIPLGRLLGSGGDLGIAGQGEVVYAGKGEEVAPPGDGRRGGNTLVDGGGRGGRCALSPARAQGQGAWTPLIR